MPPTTRSRSRATPQALSPAGTNPPPTMLSTTRPRSRATPKALSRATPKDLSRATPQAQALSPADEAHIAQWATTQAALGAPMPPSHLISIATHYLTKADHAAADGDGANRSDTATKTLPPGWLDDFIRRYPGVVGHGGVVQQWHGGWDEWNRGGKTKGSGESRGVKRKRGEVAKRGEKRKGGKKEEAKKPELTREERMRRGEVVPRPGNLFVNMDDVEETREVMRRYGVPLGLEDGE